jgi:hypothetical protein
MQKMSNFGGVFLFLFIKYQRVMTAPSAALFYLPNGFYEHIYGVRRVQRTKLKTSNFGGVFLF